MFYEYNICDVLWDYSFIYVLEYIINAVWLSDAVLYISIYKTLTSQSNDGTYHKEKVQRWLN